MDPNTFHNKTMGEIFVFTSNFYPKNPQGINFYKIVLKDYANYKGHIKSNLEFISNVDVYDTFHIYIISAYIEISKKLMNLSKNIEKIPNNKDRNTIIKNMWKAIQQKKEWILYQNIFQAWCFWYLYQNDVIPNHHLYKITDEEFSQKTLKELNLTEEDFYPIIPMV